MAPSKTLTPTNVTIQIPDFTDRPDQRVTNNCIDKEADAINALNSKIASLIATQSFTTTSASISDSAKNRITFDVTKQGYTPIGIIQTYIYVYGETKVYLYETYISGNTAYIDFFSNQSRTSSGTVQITVLYVKS